MTVQSSTPTSVAPDFDSHGGAKPRHVAIIMDGNNRWAKHRGLKGAAGHKAGEAAVQAVIEHAANRGIEVLTVFAFSSENWRRPEAEVNALMALFLQALSAKVAELHHNNIRVRFIGDLSAFAPELQQGMRDGEALTAKNTQMTVVIAANYGGQWDMANAARLAAEAVVAGDIQASEVTPEVIGRYVQVADLPPVDLLIRTGGELRLSNFLLWQSAYAELLFVDTLWPDFDGAALDNALNNYMTRQRRFGRTSEQVEALARA